MSSDKMSVMQKLLIIAIGILICFIVKCFIQFYNFYLNFLKPIKVKKLIKGEVLYQGIDIIVLEENIYLRTHDLLSFYSERFGGRQFICPLEVVDASHDKGIQAVQLGNLVDLKEYFNDDLWSKVLYALPVINNEKMTQYLSIEQEIKGSN